MSKNIKEIIPKWRFPEFMNSGQWEEKKIDTLGKPINGLNGKKSDDFGSGEPYIQYKQVFDKSYIDFSECGKVNIKDDEKQNAVQKGDVLFTTSSETPDEVGFASVVVTKPHKKTYLNSFCFILRPFDLEKTSSSFYRFLFRSSIYRKSVSAIAQGSTRYNLSKIAFLKLKIPIPPKLEEQQKIADCLSSIDDLISAEEKKLSLLNDYKKGWMQKLFPAEGKTIPDWRFPEFKDSEEWEKISLGQIGLITTGKLDANAMVEDGKYRFYTCAKEFFKIDKYAFDTEALLISGNGANVGYIHYYKGKFNAYQRTYVLHEFKKNICYVKYFLEKHLSKRIANEKNSGNTPYILRGTLSEMEIIIPEERAEQEKIADFLSGIDELISSQKEKIEKLKRHKKALMQGLFPAVEEVL